MQQNGVAIISLLSANDEQAHDEHANYKFYGNLYEIWKFIITLKILCSFGSTYLYNLCRDIFN